MPQKAKKVADQTETSYNQILLTGHQEEFV